MARLPRWVTWASWVVPALLTLSITRAAESSPPAPGTGASHTNLLRQIGPGSFQLGKVRFDKKERTVRFPAVVNQAKGPIEYLIVTSYGKIHESLLRTDAEPYHIQLALLLLGAKGAGTNAFPDDEAHPLPGEAVTIEFNWKMRSKETHAAAEQFIDNVETKSRMSPGNWVYNGSRIFNGAFMAQQDGSIVSVMVDADALINNPRPGRENDKIWLVHTAGLPPLNTPLEVVIRIRP